MFSLIRSLCNFKTNNQIIPSIHHITLYIWFRKSEKLNNFLFFEKPFFNFFKEKAPSVFHEGQSANSVFRLLCGQPYRLCEIHRSDDKPDRHTKWCGCTNRESSLESVGDRSHEGEFANRKAKHLYLSKLGKTQTQQYKGHNGQRQCSRFH